MNFSAVLLGTLPNFVPGHSKLQTFTYTVLNEKSGNFGNCRENGRIGELVTTNLIPQAAQRTGLYCESGVHKIGKI